MTIDEIFSSLSSHMIKGMMVHEQLMNSYLFLGFEGYAALHEYHYLSETNGHIRLNKYSLEHIRKLIRPNKIEDPEIIPSSWTDTCRETVDPAIRREALEAALHEWINWEEETKKLYEDCYSELLDLKEIAIAEFVKDYIMDVESEIVFAKDELLKKRAMNFDIVSIIEEQGAYLKKYKKLIKRGE